MSLTVLAKATQLAWNILEAYDIDPVPIFHDAHIDPKLMDDIYSRISQPNLEKLWRRVAKEIDDPGFALKVGKLWHPSYMHVLGYAWLASSSLRTALNRLARYICVMNQSAQLILDEPDGRMHIQWKNPSIPQDAHWHADGTMSLLITMCRANYGEMLNPVQVTFRHAKPDCAGDFFEYFRCPIEFSAEQDSLVLSLEAVDKRLPGSNPLLAQLHDQMMIEYLAKLDKNDVVHRVKATIVELLPDGMMSDTKVATALYISNRTLQRKLEEKGTTFHQILTEVRKEMAMKYLKDSQLTLTELSFHLGFSEMSAFSRAFKNWTGKSPKEYRQHTNLHA